MMIPAHDKPYLREMIREVLSEAGPSIAREAAREIAEKLIAQHIKTCPVRWEMRISLWRMVAIIAAAGGVGGGVVKLLPL